MLVLLRRLNQEVHVPDSDLVVTVLEIKRGSVLLGFKAPEDVRIFRGEKKEEYNGRRTETGDTAVTSS
jgi:carbon storage regulator CsrA